MQYVYAINAQVYKRSNNIQQNTMVMTRREMSVYTQHDITNTM
jgi:hypothetical protein